jgi:hypothetical protein
MHKLPFSHFVEILSKMDFTLKTRPKSHLARDIASSPMKVYKSYLKAKYLERKMPHYGKWPDLPTKKFINMSVIEKEKPTKDDSKALTYGNIDAVKRKSDIAFKDIAKPTEDGVLPKFVLVEGAPGVGKTTFAWEACRKWAEGEILEEFDLVILVRLRDRSVRSAKCLGDLIQYPHDAKIQSEIVSEVYKRGGKDVLLLFEGYDELPASLRQHGSLFTNIIQSGYEFDEGTVLVTSRHWASEPFLFNAGARSVSQHIEILGFTTKNIEDYISSMLHDEHALLQDMKEYLELCPHIQSMMYIPLNCAIVLEVYKTSKKHNTLIPKTTTELYSSLIRSLLLRHICDLPEYQNKVFRIDLKNLPACVRTHFSIIAELAYKAIFDKDQQIIISEDEIPSDFNSLGLMQSSMELYVDVGAMKSYNFLHLTIQEFLAAHHMSTLPIQQQVDFYCHAHAGKMVITFLAGLSPFSFEKFLTDFFHTPHMINLLLNIRLLFEARLQPTSAYVLTETLHDPFTSYMLGYLISKSSIFWNFSMDGNKDVIHFFVRGILSSGNRISEATIALNVKMDERQNTLAGLSRAAITIETLVVSNLPKFGQLSRKKFRYDNLDIGLFFSNLADGDPLIIKHLHLKSLSLRDTSMNGFKSYLENTSVLKRLTLEECPIVAEALLSQGLQACNCLEVFVVHFHPQGTMLNLTGSKSIKILEVGVCSNEQLYGVFTAMCSNNIIEELIVKKTHNSYDSPVKFVGRAMFQVVVNKMLIMSSELKSLTIDLPSDDISVICDTLSENCTLQKLTIPTFTMCEGVTNMLRLNKSLKELTILDCLLLSDCEVTKELCRNRSLEKLCLRNGPNNIANVEAVALIIKQNTTLRELEVPVQDNQHLSILSNALKHNNTLAEVIITILPHAKLANVIVTECAKDKRLTMHAKSTS